MVRLEDEMIWGDKFFPQKGEHVEYSVEIINHDNKRVNHLYWFMGDFRFENDEISGTLTSGDEWAKIRIGRHHTVIAVRKIVGD